MPSPTKHAVLSPSASARWLVCPPSARLNERLDARFGRRDTVYSREGTQGHAVGELKVRLAVWKADRMTAAKHGAMTPTERSAYPGIPSARFKALRKEIGDVDESVGQATDTYADVILERYLAARDNDPSAQLLLEQRLDISNWVPHSFGSGDCIIVSDSMLEVIDLKMGRGVKVDAAGNSQLRLYALGAYARFAPLYDFTTVRYTIVQPRLNNLSEETLMSDELLSWGEEIRPRAQLAWEGKGDFVPGEHCRFCSAKAVCAARAAQALKVFDYGLAGSGELSNEQIVSILPMLDQAEAWMKDLREYAEASAVQGEKYRGYKLVRGKKPARAWTDENEVRAQLLRGGYGPETYEKTVLRSPADIAKALGAKAFRGLLEEPGLVKQGEGSLKLVPESDPRPEYNSADAAFGDMVGGDTETTNP